MKYIQKVILIAFAAVYLMACEDRIEPDLDTSSPLLVVDAWINDKMETQTVKLSFSQAYFNNEQPAPLTGAEVVLINEQSQRMIRFLDQGNGNYNWNPHRFYKLECSWKLVEVKCYFQWSYLHCILFDGSSSCSGQHLLHI